MAAHAAWKLALEPNSPKSPRLLAVMKSAPGILLPDAKNAASDRWALHGNDANQNTSECRHQTVLAEH